MIAEKVLHDDGLEDVRMLNVTDLSHCLRISTRQCWRLHKKGLLPEPARIGERIIRWNAAEIAAWLRAGSPSRSEWESKRDVEPVPTIENP